MATVNTSINFNQVSIADLTDYNSVDASSTHIRSFDDAQNYTEFSGTGINSIVDGNGDVTDVTAGTINQIINVVGGVTQFNITGASASASAIFDFYQASDTMGAFALVLNGDDSVTGSGGNNVLFGFDGNDHIFGLAGRDRLIGGMGDDTLEGGGGRDDLQGQGGNDQLFGNLGDDTLNGAFGNDRLLGGDGDDSLLGGAGRDVLNGGNDDDTLKGQGGNDVLYGFAGSDSLEGNNGNDKLLGGKGPDILDGGPGDDTMNGGPGFDTFIFEDGFGNDRLIGFAAVNAEKIDLSGVTGINNFFDLVNNHLSAEGGTNFAVITDGADSIVLAGVDVSLVGFNQLYDAHDFIF